MKAERIFHQVKNAGERVLFGPKVEGVITTIKRDKVNGDLWHVLVKTRDDKKRHIIYPDHEEVFNGMIYFKGFVGEEFSQRVRGKGFIPVVRHERDPFGLKGKH